MKTASLQVHAVLCEGYKKTTSCGARRYRTRQEFALLTFDAPLACAALSLALLQAPMVTTFLKYDSGNKQFTPMSSTHTFTLTVDAFTVQAALGKKAKSSR